jgi:basic membrane protein A
MKYLLFVLLLVLVACGTENGSEAVQTGAEQHAESIFSDVRIAFIHVGDIGDYGYTYRQHRGTLDMMSALGIRDEQVLNFFNIAPGVAVGAAISESVEWGAEMIFGTSFAFEIHFLEAARQHPDIHFFHATGNQALASGLPNMHNYFGYMAQARFLSGIAAGLRTETNTLGFVAAFPFAEVISGFTAFYLGALSVNPDVTMYVMYTNAWNNPPLESQVAQVLIDRGADVIAQHVDSYAAQVVAQNRGVWSVGYNNDTVHIVPDSVLLSPMFDWSVYLIYAVDNFVRGIPTHPDFLAGLNEGMVRLSLLNPATIAPGTEEAIAHAKSQLLDGWNVFTGPLYDTGGNLILAAGEEFIEPLAAPSWAYIVQGITVIN